MKTEIDTYLKGITLPPKRESTRLRYCLECEYVWEESWHISRGLRCVKHVDMPTYKLIRENCHDCRGK